MLCKLINQCSSPEFLAAGGKYELVVLGSRISSSSTELKGHEQVAKAVTVGIRAVFI